MKKFIHYQILVFFIFNSFILADDLPADRTWSDITTLEEAKVLLKRGHKVNPGGDERTPLNQHLGRYEVAKFLLENGADPNVKDHTGDPPIVALAMGKGIGQDETLELIQLMIQKGAKINAVNNYKQNALIAAAYSDLPLIKLLVENGANVNSKDDTGYTVLLHAVKKPDVVKFLISKGADVNAVGKHDSETPLHRAASEGHIDSIKAILESGAKLELPRSRYTPPMSSGFDVGQEFHKVTALHIAVLARRLDVVKILVEKGSNLKALTSGKKTPLALADGAEDIMNYLKEKGAK